MKMLFLLCVMTVGIACGTYEKQLIVGKSNENKTFEEVRPLIDEHCGGCHNGQRHPLKLDNDIVWQASTARERILDGSMPPGTRLETRVKTALINSFQ